MNRYYYIEADFIANVNVCSVKKKAHSGNIDIFVYELKNKIYKLLYVSGYIYTELI